MLNNIKKALENKSNDLLGIENMNKYSVTIPLIKNNDSLEILFEKRSRNLRRQPGEISFPGGKIEKADKRPVNTAIRETIEELGIDEENIEVIHQLSPYIPNRNTIVYPFIIYINTNELNPNKGEVEEIFTVPLDFF